MPSFQVIFILCSYNPNINYNFTVSFLWSWTFYTPIFHRKIFKSERCDDTNSPEKDTKLERFRITFPKLPLPFVGSGDLFTALLTAWLTRSCNNSWQNNLDIAIALEKTVATMQAVLGRTLEHYNRNVKSNPQGLQIAALKELKLIQSRDDILNPKILQKAERVEL